MEKICHPDPKHFVLIIFIMIMSRGGTAYSDSDPTPLPPDLLTGALSVKLRSDPGATRSAATDYGLIVRETPLAVLNPVSSHDIVSLINLAYTSSVPFGIAARGMGHSVYGQAQVRDGIVVNMTSLNNFSDGKGIVIVSGAGKTYADVGGEQLWIDVLLAALQRGLTPVSWTDYLYLTVGGTLCNAGISGETFRHGPQINNVHEMDVITGTGELVTCSRESNSELFFAVLGGLGQFGIITRARIALDVAPNRVKWVRLLYSDVSRFTQDQERLILENGNNPKNQVDYVEGSVLMANAPGGWTSSFYPPSDVPRITSLVNKFGVIYSLEVARFYHTDHHLNRTSENEVVLEGLKYVGGFVFEKDVSYLEFLNRVHVDEQQLRLLGLWDVPHPWMNLFVPRSQIMDFSSAVFRDIMLNGNTSTPLVLLYPMLRSKWDDRMSAVIPDEKIFYTVGLLHSSGFRDWEAYDNQNAEILHFCDNSGIKVKHYLAHYSNKQDWKKHFASKWATFKSRKTKFDPKMILSPGHHIFNNLS